MLAISFKEIHIPSWRLPFNALNVSTEAQRETWERRFTTCDMYFWVFSKFL